LRADIATRRLRVLDANAAIARARSAARAAASTCSDNGGSAAAAEIAAPVARIVRAGLASRATLADVAALAREDALVVDACRREVRHRGVTVSLATRPVLFAIARALGEAASSRALLVERAFGARRTNDTLRARLRVEIGRLRRVLAPLGLAIAATPDGFALSARAVVLLPPADGEASLVLALLRGGEPWSSSALAAASGLGQRAVQRALAELSDARKVDAHGAGRSRRWVARPPDGFATTLLLTTRPISR
jgi:hypothetical protein